MQPAKPKLLPTLLCFGLVGLLAATLPYPTLVNNLTVLDSNSQQ